MTDHHGAGGHGSMRNRRQFLATVASGFGIASVSGCLGIVPTATTEPTYPGGTVVIENAGERSLAVSITVREEGYDASLETTVSGGKTHVSRGFVDADAGDIITLAAHLDDGDPTTFEFLPAGSEDSTRPEIARLTVQNAVEASAEWTAERAKQ